MREDSRNPRDEAILALVANCRLATTTQIERALFPPAVGSALSAARRCRRVLARLHTEGMLHRLDRRVGGVRAGSSGYLYAITTKGQRALGRTGRLRRYEPSERFVAHCLAATELHIQLVEAEAAGQISELAVVHEPATWRRFSFGSGVETLKPDLVVELTAAGWELRWFVEVDRATEHLPAVIRKCLVYQRYWQSGREAALHPVFPRVLWSVPDEKRLGAVQVAIESNQRLEPTLFLVATAKDSASVLMQDIP